MPMSVRRLVNYYFKDKLNVEVADKISLEEGEKVQRIDFNLPLGATLQGKMTIEGNDYPTQMSIRLSALTELVRI